MNEKMKLSTKKSFAEQELVAVMESKLKED